MKPPKKKLTLDQPARYQINVQNHLDESWLKEARMMMISVEREEDNAPVTIITGTFDQAALQGLLRRLYSWGLPLISVICVNGL